jgi:hypothetical protein
VIHGNGELNPTKAGGLGNSGIDFSALYIASKGDAAQRKQYSGSKASNNQGESLSSSGQGDLKQIPFKKMQTMYNQSKFYSNLLPSTGTIG